MCDYSLHAVASRPAKVGETLITTTFPGTSTRGFASEHEPAMAVCMLPGTELAFARDVKYDSAGSGRGRFDWRVGQFNQIAPEVPDRHHDAIEFPDGSRVLVTQLCEGQRVTVLQLPVRQPAERAPAVTADGFDGDDRKSAEFAAADTPCPGPRPGHRQAFVHALIIHSGLTVLCPFRGLSSSRPGATSPPRQTRSKTLSQSWPGNKQEMTMRKTILTVLSAALFAASASHNVPLPIATMPARPNGRRSASSSAMPTIRSQLRCSPAGPMVAIARRALIGRDRKCPSAVADLP